jgi:hypothetical protein
MQLAPLHLVWTAHGIATPALRLAGIKQTGMVRERHRIGHPEMAGRGGVIAIKGGPNVAAP